MTDWDKLSPQKKVEMNRDRRREDVTKHFQYKLYDLREWYYGELTRIEELFIEEMEQANVPKLIKTKWGVLFA